MLQRPSRFFFQFQTEVWHQRVEFFSVENGLGAELIEDAKKERMTERARFWVRQS
jgi:hypothetical protein